MKKNENQKYILTDVFLPGLSNRETETTGNDCGPLCILSLLRTDFDKWIGYDLIKNFSLKSLEHIKTKVNKDGKEYTFPGFICRYLEKVGYKVKYFTTINWNKCTGDPEKNIFIWDWDEKIKRLVVNPYVNRKKIQESAVWLTEHKEIVINKSLRIEDLAQALKDGKRIITIVDEGRHYVVVTGVSLVGEGRVDFIDPDASEHGTKRSMDRIHFNYYWGLTTLGLSEAIIAFPPKF